MYPEEMDIHFFMSIVHIIPISMKIPSNAQWVCPYFVTRTLLQEHYIESDWEE